MTATEKELAALEEAKALSDKVIERLREVAAGE